MLTCKQLVEQSSDYLDAQLPLRGRISVRLHLAMCVNCRRFIRQMKIIHALRRQLPEGAIPDLDSLAETLAQPDAQSRQ